MTPDHSEPDRLPGGFETALAAAGASLEARLAVVEARVVDQHAEMTLVRQRVHTLEADRATIKLLANDLARMRDDYGALRLDVREIAHEAAREAVTELLQQREQFAITVGEARRSKVSLVLQFGSLVVAFGAALSAVVIASLR